MNLGIGMNRDSGELEKGRETLADWRRLSPSLWHSASSDHVSSPKMVVSDTLNASAKTLRAFPKGCGSSRYPILHSLIRVSGADHVLGIDSVPSDQILGAKSAGAQVWI